MIARPALAAALILAAGALWLAIRSPAWPIGLAGVPAVTYAVTGGNPFPPGTTTVGMAAWAAFAVAYAVYRRPQLLAVLLAPPVLCSLALLSWLMFRLGDSLAPGYGLEKTQLFLLSNVIVLFAGAVIGTRQRDIQILLGAILGMSLITSVVVVSQLGGSDSQIHPDRFALSASEDPISMGRESAVALLIAVHLLLTNQVRWARLCLLVAIPLLVASLLASGSRGPVIGAVVGLMVLLALSLRLRKSRQRLILVAAAALACVAFASAVVPEGALTRSLSLLTMSGDVTTNGRSTLWDIASDQFERSPLLGTGTGSFAAIPLNERYPHNLLLEAATELGLVGLALVIGFLASTMAGVPRLWRSSAGPDHLHLTIALVLFATTLVNAMFSGAVHGNHALWLWAGVLVGCVASSRSSALRRP